MLLNVMPKGPFQFDIWNETLLTAAINLVCYGTDTKGHLVYICAMPVVSKTAIFHVLRMRTD